MQAASGMVQPAPGVQVAVGRPLPGGFAPPVAKAAPTLAPPLPQPSHPDRGGANRDTRPAWMTKGIGVGTTMLGEATGDLMKPGMTKAQYDEIQSRGLPDDEPDPFGDIFKERDTSVSTAIRPGAGGSLSVPAGQRRGPLPDQGSAFATVHPGSVGSTAVVSNGSGAPVNASQFDLRREYVGYIKSYNEAQGRGWIHCEEVLLLSGGDVYVHKSVIDKSQAGVNDTVQFKLHISPKGIPQAQGPVVVLESVQGKGGGKGVGFSEFYGWIKSFNEANGYGFVECPETQHIHGRDVWLSFDKAAGFCVGQEVCFNIYQNPKGEPCVNEMWAPEMPPAMMGGAKGWKGGGFDPFGGKSGMWPGPGEKGAAWGGYGEKGGPWGESGYAKGGFSEKGSTKAPQGVKRPLEEAGTKRQLCIHFQQNRCRKGTECTFAHGEHELGQAFQGMPGIRPSGPGVNSMPVSSNQIPLGGGAYRM